MNDDGEKTPKKTKNDIDSRTFLDGITQTWSSLKDDRFSSHVLLGFSVRTLLLTLFGLLEENNFIKISRNYKKLLGFENNYTKMSTLRTEKHFWLTNNLPCDLKTKIFTYVKI